MKTMWTVVIVVAILFSGIVVHAETIYTVTDLGTQGEQSYANRINEYGQVVGTCSNGAFLWTPSTPNGTVGSRMLLGYPGYSSPDINGIGQVVADAPSSLLWTPDTPNGTSGSTHSLWNGWAYSINGSGEVVGYASSGGTQGCLWKPNSPNGNVGVLYPLDGVYSARAINDYGQVAGLSTSYPNETTTVLWQPDGPNGTTGSLHGIGDLAGGRVMNYPVGMNNVGQVVGCSSSSLSDEAEAFLWTPDAPNGITGQMIGLGILPGSSASQAQDVNNLGQVVGFCWYNEKAFLWTPEEQLIDLNTRIQLQGQESWRLVDAWGINDQGQIVGNGDYDPDGPGPLLSERHAFLLNPVPEPATIGLLVIGGLTILRRRNAKAEKVSG